MKQIFTAILLLTLFASCKKDAGGLPVPVQDTVPLNSNYPNKNALIELIDQYAAQGIPGITLAIHSEINGDWGYAAGFSKKEDNTPMKLWNVHYLQSVTKTYMATAILKMKELGLVALDKPITTYLSPTYSQYIPKASQISIRHLLQHRSGVADYTNELGYIEALLAKPDRVFSSSELLAFIKEKPLNFEPDEHYLYSNTNYLLLALIGDAVSGDHARFIREKILQPLALKHTLYRGDQQYLKGSMLVGAYWDRLSNGTVENASAMQVANVSSMIGDDGMTATPFDAIRFFQGLLSNRILSAASVAEMKQWTTDDGGGKTYGFGLQYLDLGGIEAYGHGGVGIGSSVGLYYIPAKKIYLWLGTNLGAVIEGPLTAKLDELKLELLQLILQ